MTNLKTNTIICLAIFFMTGISSIAQNWNLLQEGKQWNNIHSYYSFDVDRWVIRNTSTMEFTSNDTLINDTLYKKLFILESGSGSMQYFGRENDEGFFVRRSDNMEFPLYLYNLKEGAFFYAKNIYQFDTPDSIPVFVTGIDSVLINGAYKKRYNIACPYNYTDGRADWIEGIGSLSGIMTPFLNEFFTGGREMLLCYSENGQVLFKNPILGLPECYYEDYVLATDKIEVDDINIHPNPVSNILQIIGVNNMGGYKIFNLNGKCILQGLVTNNQVDVSSLYSGVFFLELIIDGKTYCKKIVKVPYN